MLNILLHHVASMVHKIFPTAFCITESMLYWKVIESCKDYCMLNIFQL